MLRKVGYYREGNYLVPSPQQRTEQRRIMITQLVIKLLEACFAQAEQAEAEFILIAECSNGLPMVDGDLKLIERIQVSVIKLSRGDLILLKKWIGQANEDWRDVLDSAGFYRDPNAHLSWKP